MPLVSIIAGALLACKHLMHKSDRLMINNFTSMRYATTLSQESPSKYITDHWRTILVAWQ